MAKWYGSLDNRVEENKYYNGTYDNIKVGTLATEYLWSDRHAYEVVSVKDQKHVSIRRLKAIRTDSNGMSECQTYRFERDLNQPTIELKKGKKNWLVVHHYTDNEGKPRTRSSHIDISFGVAEEYYDFSF